MKYVIGIDIGTTHTKAVVSSTTGEVLYEDKAHYPTLQPLPGYSEQEPASIFEAVVKVLETVLANVSDEPLTVRGEWLPDDISGAELLLGNYPGDGSAALRPWEARLYRL